MHEFTIKQASLSYRWACDAILPALPLPGTPSFTGFIKRLQAYKVAPADVAVDAPGNRLSDVALIVLLLGREVTLRVTYTGFEIYIGKLFEEHIPRLPGIAEAALAALTDIDAAAKDGRIVFSYTAHIGSQPQVADRILRQYVSGGCEMPTLAPDAFAYRIRLENRPDVLQMRIVVAKSLFFEEALFVDFGAEYRGLPSSAETAGRIRQDYYEALTTLGMRLNTDR